MIPSETSSTPTSSLTWITWFCSLPGHEYFSEVSEDFIEDDFNLTGLNSLVPFWKEAMEMVLDVEPEEDSLKIPDVSIVETSAELLYGLVHQRYILTRAGLAAMVEKYESGQFGSCPRVFCAGQYVVPCGRSDLPGLETVKLYCANCNDIYTPPSSRFQGVDGAFFGTTFPHLFFQTYRELAPAPYFNGPTSSSAWSHGGSPVGTPASSAAQISFVNPNPYGGQKLPYGTVYVPRIYGFRVSERARSGPRMQWLRLRPQTAGELDMVDWRGRWIGSDDYEEGDEEGSDGKAMEDFDPVSDE
ncbi:putative casein kinase II beta chain [Hysterangium stoloniferum]|nr:putative casein kinase II beta chain [Hysterangium stoloniferum]